MWLRSKPQYDNLLLFNQSGILSAVNNPVIIWTLTAAFISYSSVTFICLFPHCRRLLEVRYQLHGFKTAVSLCPQRAICWHWRGMEKLCFLQVSTLFQDLQHFISQTETQGWTSTIFEKKLKIIKCKIMRDRTLVVNFMFSGQSGILSTGHILYLWFSTCLPYNFSLFLFIFVR